MSDQMVCSRGRCRSSAPTWFKARYTILGFTFLDAPRQARIDRRLRLVAVGRVISFQIVFLKLLDGRHDGRVSGKQQGRVLMPDPSSNRDANAWRRGAEDAG